MEQANLNPDETILLMMDFLGFDGPGFPPPDWNTLHYAMNKLSKLHTGKPPIDLEIISCVDTMKSCINSGDIEACYINLVAFVTWYESQFKKPKTRKNAQQNQDIQ